jgi:hypothetical protein
MAALTLVGSRSHRPVRQARRDVFVGGGQPASGRLGFGEAPPLKHRPRGALAAEPTAGPVEKVWVRCHICSRMFGNPGAPCCHRAATVPQQRPRSRADVGAAPVPQASSCTSQSASSSGRTASSQSLRPGACRRRSDLSCRRAKVALSSTTSSRRRHPIGAAHAALASTTPSLVPLTQACASHSCRLCPCPKCSRTFEPERLEAPVRTCEEEPDPDAEPPPKHAWGRITRVGDGWELDELQRFSRQRRRAGASAPSYFDAETSAYRTGIKHSSAVKTDPWDVNGLGKRELIKKINTNLEQDGAKEAEAAELQLEQQAFKAWLCEAFPAKPKTRQSVFSERLVPR